MMIEVKLNDIICHTGKVKPENIQITHVSYVLQKL